VKERVMVRNIIIVLSLLLMASIISGLVLYGLYSDTKGTLLSSEKQLSDLNEKISQMKGETSVLHDRISKNDQRLKDLRSAKVHTLELESEVEKKSDENTISKLREKIQNKEAMIAELQGRLKKAESQILSLNHEIGKGQNEFEQSQRILSGLKGEESQLKGQISQLKSTYEAIVSELKDQIQNREVTISKLEESLSVAFIDSVLFELGKASITAEGREILARVGKILKSVQGRQIRVVGHTDNIRILSENRYRFPSNWELSAARAASVARYFQSNTGLDPRNLEVVGRSFYEPIASNKTEKGRGQNRRVEVTIAPKIDLSKSRPK
jgi:chemotaxis protein MotB